MDIKSYKEFIIESLTVKPPRLYQEILIVDDRYVGKYQHMSEEDINHVKELTKLAVDKRLSKDPNDYNIECAYITKHFVESNPVYDYTQNKYAMSHPLNKVTRLFITKMPDDYFQVRHETPYYSRTTNRIYSVDGWDGLAQIIKDFKFYE